MPAFLVPFLISLAVSTASYLIMPKPKAPRPEAARQLEAPTADAGIPVPVIFGRVTITAPNCMGQFDQSQYEYKVKV